MIYDCDNKDLDDGAFRRQVLKNGCRSLCLFIPIQPHTPWSFCFLSSFCSGYYPLISSMPISGKRGRKSLIHNSLLYGRVIKILQRRTKVLKIFSTIFTTIQNKPKILFREDKNYSDTSKIKLQSDVDKQKLSASITSAYFITVTQRVL